MSVDQVADDLANVRGLLGKDGTGALFKVLLRELAKGTPVTPEQLARELCRPEEEVQSELSALPNLELASDGKIVGMGLSLTPTPHVLKLEGRRLYTWCALDTILIPVILGVTAQVSSPCAASGTPVQLTVAPSGLTNVEPASAVISLLRPSAGSQLRRTFCDQVHFFASREAASEWLSSRPTGEIVGLEAAFGLALQFTARRAALRRSCS